MRIMRKNLKKSISDYFGLEKAVLSFCQSFETYPHSSRKICSIRVFVWMIDSMMFCTEGGRIDS